MKNVPFKLMSCLAIVLQLTGFGLIGRDHPEFQKEVSKQKLLYPENINWVVTFNVDMTNATEFNPLTDEVYISGSFIGWPQPGTNTDFKFEPDPENPMIYSLTFEEIPEGEIQYKYFRVINNQPSWDWGEWMGDPNRIVNITGNTTIDNVWGILNPEEPFGFPFNFDDQNIDYNLIDFGGNYSYLTQDPENFANFVAMTYRPYYAESWAGTIVGCTYNLPEPIPFEPGFTTMTVRVWAPEADIPILLKAENVLEPTISVETLSYTTQAQTWEEITFDFSSELQGTEPINFDNDYRVVVIFFNFDVPGYIAGEQTFYWDDIDFVGNNSGQPTTIFFEDFNNNLGAFNAYNVTGEQVWGWANFDGGCAVMSGYQGSSNENEDWLISPAISLAGYTDVTLSFREAINFITSISDMAVMISSDYDGESNPSQQGTWTELTGFDRAPGNNWTFVESGEVGLEEYHGKTIFIAFKYLSTFNGAATWEVSRIEIKGVEALISDFSSSATEICEFESITFLPDTSMVIPDSIFWSFPGGNPETSTQLKPEIEYPVKGTFDVTMTAYYLGDTLTISKPEHIQVFELPIIPAQPQGEEMICFNQQSSSYATNNTNVIWHIMPANAGSISYSDSACVVFWNDAFSGTAELRVQSFNDCGTSDFSEALVIEKTENPDTDFTATPLFIPEAPYEVQFANHTPNPEQYNFTWHFGNGDTSQETEPNYTYSESGMYFVSLVAYHIETGCSDTLTKADYIHCSATGISDIRQEGFRYYVNHREKTLELIFDETPENCQLALYNINGALELRMELNRKITRIPVQNLSYGLYLFTINQGNTNLNGKIIIK
jgi:PKD repeat protein